MKDLMRAARDITGILESLDVQDIFFIQGRVDESYLHHWAAALGVTDRLEQALRDREGPSPHGR